MTHAYQPAADLEAFLEGIDDGTTVATLLERPREERLAELAKTRGEEAQDLLVRLAQAAGLPLLHDFEPLLDGPAKLPSRLIHEYQCLPIVAENARGGLLDLVTVWPPDPEMDRWIFAVTGKRARWYLGPPEDVANTITQHFGIGSGSLEDSGLEFAEAGQQIEESEDQNAAIIRFVNEVVQRALQDRATDIHFEPHKDALQIRYRIDGELIPVRVPDNLVNFQGAIISRLKIMARLNISEKRRPQDGRINFSIGQTELDIRISTFPTLYGESVSLRLLNQKNQPLSIAELGLLPSDEERVNRSLARPYGIILVTGPTGSGKSTSLTAFIRKINLPGRRIITVEDPVEYEVPGVNQTQVKPEIGLNFASALRHVLRQDPDVIMVGEVRDRETADIAIRASLTGHLVLSTLHTNDAPGALTRLIDMDIEPFLVASAVEMIIAQRLVRTICPNCARPNQFPEAYIRSCLGALGLDPAEAGHGHLARVPVGCDRCRGLGYLGRIGIFEILRINDQIHELIVQRASARKVRDTAIAQGMKSLQYSGWEQVKAGRTSLEEVMRFSEVMEASDNAAGVEAGPVISIDDNE